MFRFCFNLYILCREVNGNFKRADIDESVHNGVSVWFNNENGNYLFWNSKQQRLQVYENVIDDSAVASLTYGDYWHIVEFGNNARFDQHMRLIASQCPGMLFFIGFFLLVFILAFFDRFVLNVVFPFVLFCLVCFLLILIFSRSSMCYN